MWNMMCDVMPTISEDGIPQRNSQLSGDDANFEQLMVSMLDERDKLMDTLRETQVRLGESETKLAEVEKERDSLQRQLSANLPQVSGLLFSSCKYFMLFSFIDSSKIVKCLRVSLFSTMRCLLPRVVTSNQYFPILSIIQPNAWVWNFIKFVRAAYPSDFHNYSRWWILQKHWKWCYGVECKLIYVQEFKYQIQTSLSVRSNEVELL